MSTTSLVGSSAVLCDQPEMHVETHRPYSRRERIESSVTETLKYLPAEGLKWGAAKETALFAYFHPEEWEDLPEAEAVRRLMNHHRGVWNGRAAMGTLLHKANEARADKTPFRLEHEIKAMIESESNATIWKSMDLEDVFEQALGYLIGLDNWWDDYAPEVLATESVLRCKGFHIGQMDLAMKLVIDERVVCVDLKGLSLDTPLPTPSGWTTMGHVAVGDEVFGSDGRPCRVVAKSEIHQVDCYRLRFDDGSSIVCDADHRWAVQRTSSGKRTVLTTSELAAECQHPSRSQHRYTIDNALPLDLPDAELPLDPYLLGAWLGDGTRCDSRITLPGPKEPIAQAFRDAGFEMTPWNGNGYGIKGFRPYLRACGQMGEHRGDTSIDKHVPAAYLRGSYGQRLALLQGLMDTDGSWNKVRRQVAYVTVDKQMAADVFELVVSLGWRAAQNSYKTRGFGLEVDAHLVAFTPFGANPFRLVAHKRDQVRIEGSNRCRRRIIQAVEPTVTVATQCIAVDSPDNTYLCGEQMVPTHNTTAQQDEDKALYLDKWIYQTNAYNFSDEQVFYTLDAKGKLVECCTVPWEPGDACAVIHLRGNDTGGPDGRGYEYFELPCDRAIHEQFHNLCKFQQHHKGLPKPREIRRAR